MIWTIFRLGNPKQNLHLPLAAWVADPLTVCFFFRKYLYKIIKDNSGMLKFRLKVKVIWFCHYGLRVCCCCCSGKRSQSQSWILARKTLKPLVATVVLPAKQRLLEWSKLIWTLQICDCFIACCLVETIISNHDSVISTTSCPGSLARCLTFWYYWQVFQQQKIKHNMPNIGKSPQAIQKPEFWSFSH